MKALVIEDEKALHPIYATVLASVGYDVDFAITADEAIHQLEEMSPKLVFLDIRLPGKNGFSVLEYMMRYTRFDHTHIVVSSSGQEFAHNLPRGEFILKPILPQTIANIARRILQSAV